LPACARDCVDKRSAAEAVGEGRIRQWDAAVSRGRPRLFALMPYQVADIDVETGFHVVHMDIYAPGCDTPRREYSHNIDCPNGAGEAAILFALNDAPGVWRLSFTDAAPGTRPESSVTMSRRA